MVGVKVVHPVEHVQRRAHVIWHGELELTGALLISIGLGLIENVFPLWNGCAAVEVDLIFGSWHVTEMIRAGQRVAVVVVEQHILNLSGTVQHRSAQWDQEDGETEEQRDNVLGRDDRVEGLELLLGEVVLVRSSALLLDDLHFVIADGVSVTGRLHRLYGLHRPLEDVAGLEHCVERVICVRELRLCCEI